MSLLSTSSKPKMNVQEVYRGAFVLLEQVVLRDDQLAWQELRNFYLNNRFLPHYAALVQNIFNICTFYATCRGSPSAAYVLSTMLTGNWDPITSDENQAFIWAQRSAEMGNPFGLLTLGFYHAIGIGVKVDEKKALEYYELAAESGSIQALHNLGNLYLHGENVERNEEKAITLFRQAKKKGWAHTLCLLAYCYHKGIYFEKDDVKSSQLYLKASQIGSELAMFNLALNYMHGRGLPKDESAAYRWLKSASSLGSIQASNELLQNGITPPTTFVVLAPVEKTFIFRDFLVARYKEPTSPWAKEKMPRDIFALITQTYMELGCTLPPSPLDFKPDTAEQTKRAKIEKI